MCMLDVLNIWEPLMKMHLIFVKNQTTAYKNDCTYGEHWFLINSDIFEWIIIFFLFEFLSMKSIVCLLDLYIIVGLSKIAEILYLQRVDNGIINNWTCNITRLKHVLFEFNCSFEIAVLELFFKIVNNSDFMEVLRMLFSKLLPS